MIYSEHAEYQELKYLLQSSKKENKKLKGTIEGQKKVIEGLLDKNIELLKLKCV